MVAVSISVTTVREALSVLVPPDTHYTTIHTTVQVGTYNMAVLNYM